jgi:hypothetical protein
MYQENLMSLRIVSTPVDQSESDKLENAAFASVFK